MPETLTTKILANSDAFAYHRSQPYYKNAPLYALSELATQYRFGNLFVKDESSRFGLQAFKSMGASYAIYRILQLQPNIQVFCTATDGNHGRSVAWAARLAGKKSVVFVPSDTTANRIQAIANEGAEVVQVNGNYEQTSHVAKTTSKKEGWTLVQDAANEGYEEIPAYIMAGYLTHFMELEENFRILNINSDTTSATLHTDVEYSLLPVDIIFLQAGVGTWAATAIWYYIVRYKQLCIAYKKQLHEDIKHPNTNINTLLIPRLPKFVIVEPLEADGILQSFKDGRRSSPRGNNTTIMAGLNCGLPSSTAWEIIQSYADVAIRINDTYTEKAIRKLYYPTKNDAQILAGESGASGLAGLLAVLEEMPEVQEALGITQHSSILVFNTEGPTDLDNFEKIIAKKF